MSLLAIKKHMMQVKMTTLSSLCTLFHADPEMIRCLLRHWIKKGKIRQCMKKPACGSQCFKCPATSVEIYEWVDVDASLLQP